MREVLDALAGAFRPPFIQMKPSLQIEVIGLQILGRRLHQAAARIAGNTNRQRADDGARNLVLHGEDVREPPVVGFRPHVVAVGHTAELGGDAQTVAGSLHAVFQHGGHVELAAHAADIGVLPFELEGGPARDHAQSADLGEGVDQVVGQAVAEVLVFFIGTQVHKGKHGNGRRIRSCGPRMRFPGQQVAGGERGQHQKRSNHPPIGPPDTARRGGHFFNRLDRPAWQGFKAGQVPALRQIDPDGVGGAFRFVILLEARSQFDGFHADYAIQARVIRRDPAEDLDAEQRFLELISGEGLLDDAAQEPARPFSARKCATGKDFGQLRADRIRRGLGRAVRAGGNRSVLFPSGGGYGVI